jgi:hypothetical protein
MKAIFIPFFILISLTVYGQKKRTSTKRFVYSITQFIGNWKGEMVWTPNSNKPAQKVPVQLKIQKIKDSTNQYTWQITYGDKSEDIRPYILKKIDTLPKHWVIDEQNGIVLDSYFMQGKLIGAFSVNGITIVDNYWIENDSLHFEFISYSTEPSTTTGKGTEDSPTVNVYQIKSYQKGVLKKVK